jgi:hypothetical protein
MKEEHILDDLEVKNPNLHQLLRIKVFKSFLFTCKTNSTLNFKGLPIDINSSYPSFITDESIVSHTKFNMQCNFERKNFLNFKVRQIYDYGVSSMNLPKKAAILFVLNEWMC